MEEKEKYKIWFDEENEVMRAVLYQALDSEGTSGFFHFVKDNFEPELHRYFFIELAEESQTLHDKQTRKTIRETINLVNWGKIAIHGANPTLRMLGKIVFTAIGRGRDLKFFDTEEEALAWLKDEKGKEKESK
ncbi:hypothetical protein CEE36_03205 [candidate division TA06 bacterium B3_TA06]|uniref:STAS/SEC14 domain-containing protein n=1 Tax=candidate division TA06 bacterium B3_TA06 TaxID=2012487 RepID=A0A532V966_UNCT6|nr:MAG: hypothetical protein CEE36_03205 [candidate division TA06 bacterium B3_TA06]